MRTWFVANDSGEIAGHDMSEISAQDLASRLQAEEPDAGWEALGDETPRE